MRTIVLGGRVVLNLKYLVAVQKIGQEAADGIRLIPAVGEPITLTGDDAEMWWAMFCGDAEIEVVKEDDEPPQRTSPMFGPRGPFGIN